MSATGLWPALDYRGDRETLQTLQNWTQIVGKIRLARTPWRNHSWHVPLYVGARGLGTSPIAFDDRLVEIEFDFIEQRLRIEVSDGARREIPLVAQSVADFYRTVFAALAALGLDVTIDRMPNEMPSPLRFDRDTAARIYDGDTALRLWRALARMLPVFERFRTGFLGKASPVHFFWGSFDLAASRFSGRRAPPHGGAPGLPFAVAREAYSHEVSSAGFFPGNDTSPQAAFYAYAYPTPDGFAAASIEPASARFHETLGEWLLRYDDVRSAPAPEAAIERFLITSYEAAADLLRWDRSALECAIGRPGVPRPVAD